MHASMAEPMAQTASETFTIDVQPISGSDPEPVLVDRRPHAEELPIIPDPISQQAHAAGPVNSILDTQHTEAVAAEPPESPESSDKSALTISIHQDSSSSNTTSVAETPRPLTALSDDFWQALSSPASSSVDDYDPFRADIEPDLRIRTPTHKLSSSTLSPSPASEHGSHLDFGASTSSISSTSAQSVSSQQSEAGLQVKKRGYMRPQATNFSESAKSRESVLNLGSIAHLQYYFARTGLLDGKGGQFARKTTQFRSGSLNSPQTPTDEMLMSPATDYNMSFGRRVTSESDADWDRELAMLPPTVSTYNQKPAYVQPPPDLTMLRRELTEALENALKGLKESDSPTDQEASPGWYEIQGLHLLDIITLAIRAAKNYYTAHSQFQRLHAIKSERTIRRELYQVLEILKRMATRNFAGGLRQNEKVEILSWIVGISELIQTEIDQEKRETEERAKWTWRQGDWTGREREREYAFMRCFISDPDGLPDWQPPCEASDTDTADPAAQGPTAFLQYFRDGLQLVQLHNTLVQKSQRPFETISKFHSDTNKPYRCADNLRYWLKAAALRWDLALALDVMAVVQAAGGARTWRQFDEAILRWCRGVREEFTLELAEARDGNGKRTPPRLRIDGVVSSPTLAASPLAVSTSISV